MQDHQAGREGKADGKMIWVIVKYPSAGIFLASADPGPVSRACPIAATILPARINVNIITGYFE